MKALATNPVKKHMERLNRPTTHKDKKHHANKYACRKAVRYEQVCLSLPTKSKLMIDK